MTNIDKLKQIIQYLEMNPQTMEMSFEVYNMIFKRKVMSKKRILKGDKVEWNKLEIHLDQMIENAEIDLLFLQDLVLKTKEAKDEEFSHLTILDSYSQEVVGLTHLLIKSITLEKYEISRKIKTVIDNEINDLTKLIKLYFPEELKEEAEEELKIISFEHTYMMNNFLLHRKENLN